MKLLNIEARHGKKTNCQFIVYWKSPKGYSAGCLFANLGPVHATKRIIGGHCRTIWTCESKWLS